MAVSPATIANYAPWGNATLSFEVGNNAYTVDPSTGNTIQGIETLDYLAALSLQAPNWKAQSGVDATTYMCTGRLLSPAVLDTRITNGSQADCVINGYRGRFELIVDLQMDRNAYQDIRQSLKGTFRVVGGSA